MDIYLKQKLTEVYKSYGFTLAKSYETDEVLVFTLKTGYFDNADIVPTNQKSNSDQAFKEFSDSGFACTIRPYMSPLQAEQQLFNGFFSVESVLARLSNDYHRFTNAIVSVFSSEAKYEYINAPYLINGRMGMQSPADEVISRIEIKKPTLFLIEAAAGFGKTCAAYELVNKLTKKGGVLPLFSELARNRQAVIFRHILLDEIDHTFPMLSSRLVQNEMRNGRVITILDGFDELLRKNEDGSEFENHEPMLETIGEFLTGNAKIVLTTRRTILFEGDAFHNWVDKHTDDFDLIRIKISEPRVADWLPESRLSALSDTGLKVEHIANPVLLSYLRCISDDKFSEVASKPHELVERYFEFMLDRETIRQDLRISQARQQRILKSIAEDMMNFGYTSESRDYIVDQIARDNSRLIEDAIASYPPGQRPTKDEVANKLASHALLDRNIREPDKIGFVNEFVFGHFVAQVITKDREWISDDLRFIEPAVISYQPRSFQAKEKLWHSLESSLEFLSASDKVDFSAKLLGSVTFDLKNDEAQGIDFTDIQIGAGKIDSFQFNECVFRRCSFDLRNLSNVTFLNCKYYDCSILESNAGGPIHELGGTGDDAIIEMLTKSTIATAISITPDRQQLIERAVLERFWPVGRDTVTHKHRPIKGICAGLGEFKNGEVLDTITVLKRKDILRVPHQSSFVEINFEKILEIRDILGRTGSVNGN
ncbi:NACHT domain-containing protein [Undibacterium squillarum]|uniref:NACHT-associated inactive Restriction Endonuclease 2 domain-containing protein n=1 Tax=Undibacterium squillarum TaxID=1131567 RepID=A0ABQ2XRR2_9BURK|nr:hypothetical protein [Undibacterium squillarum]GGX29688.1 hypothetical protein GCM10010946_03300 [Undibacterium squillarum]